MTGFLIILCMSRNLFDNLLKALDSSQKNKNFFYICTDFAYSFRGFTGPSLELEVKHAYSREGKSRRHVFLFQEK